MNSSINFANMGSGFCVFAAGLVFAYGVWVGRHDLGLRGAWGVLLSVIVSSLLPFMLLQIPLLGMMVGGSVAGGLGLILLTTVSTLLSFVPLYIAVNWMEVIRDAGRARS